MTLDILCRVVDNYGDIGVVYRLAKALSDREPGLELRLLVDDLRAFRALCPAIDPALPVQRLGAWTILPWDRPWEGFLRERPRRVLECFACGRPEWYEGLLYDPADPAPRLVLNVEHLTAEAWAEDFHLLPAATRSPLVKKYFFMPGFGPGTGGLILDKRFRESLERWEEARRAGPERLAAARRAWAREAGMALPAGAEAALWIPVFSYERDYGPILADLAAFAASRPLLLLAAAGRSQSCVTGAWQALGRPFPLLELPFLAQELWDEILLAADFSVVRGEESLARAALTGRPFLWQAYLQEGAHQLVKVRALLDRMRPRFEPADFGPYEALSLAFNDRLEDGMGIRGSESLLPVLRRLDALGGGFEGFAAGLRGLGDLAEHLLTFLRDFG